MTHHGIEKGPVLVVGGTGFVGRGVVGALLRRGHGVRVVARSPERARLLFKENVEVVDGDLGDPASLTNAMRGTHAVVVSVQAVTTAQRNFRPTVDAIEREAAQALIRAAQEAGTSRLVSVGVIGSARDARNPWLRARANADALLLGAAGLNVTIMRPGLVAGSGGLGFDGILRAAKQSVAIVTGSGKQRWRTVSVEDFALLCVDVLDDERTYDRAFDVGSDEVATYDELVDRAAEVLGSRPPLKLHLPASLLKVGARLIERLQKLTPGGLTAAIDHLNDDLVGDVAPLRAIVPRRFAGWEEIVKTAVNA